MSSKHLLAAMTVAFLMPVLAAASAEDNSTVIDSRIDRVTVYPDRAGVVRLSTLNLPAGEHSILFEGLPIGIDPASFRSSARGPRGTMVLGLTHETVAHLDAPQARAAELERQIQTLERETRQALQVRLEVLNRQRDLLAALAKEHGEEPDRNGGVGRLDMANWAAAYEFLSRHLVQVGDSVRLVTIALEDADRQLALLREQLDKLRADQGRETRTVRVDLALAQAGTVEIELQYTVAGAGWRPIYDARLRTAADSVELACFGEVIQRTGEDWENVALTLSTAIPSQGMEPAAFRPFFLSVLSDAYEAKRQRNTALEAPAPAMMDMAAMGKAEQELAEAVNAAAIINAGGLATTFTAARREDVPCDGRGVRAPIAQWTFGGTLALISRPRFADGAYRRVTMTNTSDAPFLPGRVAVFAGSDFLGSTAFTKFIAAGETFDLPFGRDNDVTVERKIVRHEVGDGSTWLGIGGNRRRVSETVAITIKNNGRRARTITIEEPLPVSQDDRIEVSLKDFSRKPDDQDESGRAIWTVTVNPGAEDRLTYWYEIVHPADVIISGI